MMTDTLQQLLHQISQFLPRFIGALTVLLLGFIVSKFVASLVRKLLEKIRIDQLGEKLMNVDFIRSNNIQIKISAIISKFLYYFLFIFFLVAASDLLQMPAISSLVTDLFKLLPKLLVGFVILIFGILISDMLKGLVETTLTSLAIPSAKIIANFLFYFLFINVVILAIAQADINTAFLEQNISIIIGGGVLAFAIGYGLASRDVVANFLSSLYTSDKVSIGDMVEIGGEIGQVINMDKTSITVASADRKVIFPLRQILNEKISIIGTNKKIES